MRKRYIYPGNAKHTTFETDKPYEHGIFADNLCDILRSGRKHAIMARHQDRFAVTWQGSTTNEISKPLLALVATAIHAALCDKKFKGVKPARFTAEEFLSIYETHFGVLVRLEHTHPRVYHRLMEQLYRKSVHTLPSHLDGDEDADNVFEDLDLNED
ncbi:hypothetical protein BDW22DRAFT_1475662 [Trametopsis cervina]|nr:hypothetical protein BDW22DRAFT_1475662 [Trametopsis cervina]